MSLGATGLCTLGVDAEPHPLWGIYSDLQLYSDYVIESQTKGMKWAFNDESYQPKFVINSSLLKRQIKNNPKLTSRDIICFKVSEQRLMGPAV